jgi:hypothetical protein
MAAIFTAATLLLAVRRLTPEPVRVDVELAVSAGTTIEVFVNDLTRPPLRQPLVPGERRTYSFGGIVEDIAMLRLDPTDAADAIVDVYSIAVVGSQGSLKQFEPAAIAGWSANAITVDSIEESAVHLRTSSTDPILTTSTTVPVRRYAAVWTQWVPLVNSPDSRWHVAAASLVLLLAAGLFDRSRLFHVPVAVSACLLVYGIVVLLPRLSDGPASAALAVSRATFLGLSTRPAQLASVVLVIGALVIGATAALLDTGRHATEPVGRPMASWHVVAGFCALVAVFSPDLANWVVWLSEHQFVPNWDSDLVTYWAYQVQAGKLPWRDFWYPYAGFYLFDLPFPTGAIYRWLQNAALFGVFFVAIGKWRGTSSAILGTTLLFFGYRAGFLPAIERYLLPFNVALTFVFAGREGQGQSARVVFWCAYALALVFEPVQLMYAAVPISVIVLSEVVRRRGDIALISRRLLIDAGVAFLITAFVLTRLAMSGQLPGFLFFYGRLGDIVSYHAWPTGFPTLDSTGFPRALFVVLTCAISIAIGAYEYFRGGARRVYGQALLGVGLVSLMVLQKHFVRWIDNQLFLPAFTSVFVFAAGWPGRRRIADYLAGGVLLGTAVATLGAHSATAPALRELVDSPARVFSSISLLWNDYGAIEDARRAAFARERFQLFRAALDVREWIRKQAGDTTADVFTLTDDPVLYILTDQPSMWMVNLYNGSPAYEQARMVSWLQTHKPRFCVLDTDRLMWDGFQQVVRAPIVFNEVIDTYVPADIVGRLDVLRRRQPGEPLALDFWRDRLGTDVNIGRLASISSYVNSLDCETECGDVLRVEMAEGGSGSVTIPFTVSDSSFSVTFARVPSERVYHVLLDRIWFWNVAKRAGLDPIIGPAPEAARLEHRRVAIRRDVLY